MIMKGMGAAALSLVSVAVLGQTQQPAGLPAEMPEKFVATLVGYDSKRENVRDRYPLFQLQARS